MNILKPGPYWLTKFATVSGVRIGRLPVRLIGAVSGECGKVYRVMLPHGVVSVAERKNLIAREA